MSVVRRVLVSMLPCLVLAASASWAQTSSGFVNWEHPHVHPLELTPDGARLLAVNTADNRLLVFSLSSGTPVLTASIPVGLDPVSVRARSNTEAWVVNHVSDSVSIVDLTTSNVKATVPTDDEPADVVFAGTPQRAFISCSQVNRVLVVDASNPLAAPTRVALQGEEPRALAVNAAGTQVYVAFFESGNRTTVLGGGNAMGSGGFPPNVVSSSAGPYGGVNPPPNSGTTFNPPKKTGNPAPPPVGLIVKKDASGRWLDDNRGDWTRFVSGSSAASSGRRAGWDLPDRDLAIINASTLAVTYASGLMNLDMALSVHPGGRVVVVGTDATNEVRFEPNLKGRFLRVLAASVDPANPSTVARFDLNPHLTYTTPSLPQATRDLALGDPRGIAWNTAGTRAYVTGMGSNNVAVMDDTGARITQVNVGEGPTGVVLSGTRLYVLNKFSASLSIVDTSTNTELFRVPFFDPTPIAIKAGRPHLYDTHKSSGLGHIACASCHIDGRLDRLAWDLGDPSGNMKPVTGQNLGMGIPGLTAGFQSWHTMKGPITTQTLQDIIGKEPLHWRGDRAGLEEFNDAFQSLQGDDTLLTLVEMQQFEDFLATLTFPPNPFRNLDNSLPTSLPLPGHFTTGRFGTAGQPLPNGNAVNGLRIYRPPRLLDSGRFACSTCHTLPTGMGADVQWNGNQFVPFAAGPGGERHTGLISVDGFSNVTMKISQLRNLYEKVGMEFTQTSNLAGFGFSHDGGVDSIARFLTLPVFTLQSDQEVADMVAFMLAFSGSDLPKGSNTTVAEPPGPDSKDTHAAVGRQVTLTSASPTTAQTSTLTTFLSLADTGKVGVVVKGLQGGVARGFTYMGGGLFQTDRAAETVTASLLQTLARAGGELTYTVVPKGSEVRIGIDRDLDGALDRDELDRGTRPDDPASRFTP
ncbi:YncE family protein [Myxococcus landrumensis]|uniref:Beta-propeller fold lactonase family protein n=1 Tax=Myxococcus landrumensis TaxID=2813577 RepID=A0ABX7N154_9BACT|nr:beta-propeller fold lactonase family protein [Myxococcus landrumus]QSQ12318.1 beta-propeller fold lactonase family protein [Myxococcus landrumus]